jgi:hypothetical protein
VQQFSGGQATTADQFPELPASSGVVSPGAALLGPSAQGAGVLLSVYNALIDLQMMYRDPEAGGAIGFRYGPVIVGLYPGGFTFPSAIGFRARSHAAGVPGALIAQVWDLQDGPLPQTPLSPNVQTLSGGGIVPPPVGISIAIVPLASFPPASPTEGQIIVLVLPASYDPVGGKTLRWLLCYDSTNLVWGFIGGPPITVHAASTTLIPRPGDYIVAGKGDLTGGGGSTTGSNQTPTITVAGVTKDSFQTANVPASSGSLFNYGGSGSSFGMGGVVAEALAVAAGATVAINPGGDPRIQILPVRIT